jgi:serine/threonine protein kinase
LYSEAKNLIERLLDSNPMKRYTINFFSKQWISYNKLSFEFF